MKKVDLILLVIVSLVTLFGFFMVYDASSFISFRDFGDKYHYVKDQSVWMILGFLGMFFFTKFDYHKLYTIALPLLLVALGLLFAVFLPGVGVGVLGAHRWINLRLTILQPAEFVKLTLAIYLAAWFSSKERGRFLPFILLLGLVIGLIMLEPDMGTAIIILFEALILFFLSGGNLLYFGLLAPIVAIVGYILILLEPYRAKRLSTFFNSSDGATGASYHVHQILIALGSGGLTGVGIGNSLQKYAYLPENTTDSIFAIIAEELGLVGSTVLFFVLLLIVWRGMLIATRAKDLFGKYLASGIVAFLGMQMIINLGAQTALIPLTGVPLPFISYGGSALIIDLCSVGILLNIGRQGHQV